MYVRSSRLSCGGGEYTRGREGNGGRAHLDDDDESDNDFVRILADDSAPCALGDVAEHVLSVRVAVPHLGGAVFTAAGDDQEVEVELRKGNGVGVVCMQLLLR
jgi:hypothetical protein